MQPQATVRSAGKRRAARRAVLSLLSGLFLCVPPAATLAAQERTAGLSAPRDPIDAHVVEAAQRFGIPAVWIRAVMRVESAGDRAAVSPKGAMGLMQIMPATWDYLSARHALGRDPFDPRANILAGAAYLRELHDRYGSPGFLAAYNAGPGRYEASLYGRPLPGETVAYVAALAPAIDGRVASGAVQVAAIDPQAWRSATLFVARAARHQTDRAASVEDAHPVANAQSVGEPETGGAPQRETLFVARPNVENAP